MKAILCLPVDFRTNDVGLPSLLAEEIDGAPVLRHAVSRLTLSDDYRVVLLFADGPATEDDRALAREMLSGLDYDVHVSAAPDVPQRGLLRRTRLWSLRSWRGGISGTSYFDEFGNPSAMLEAAKRFGADAVGLLSADSPFADPALASKIFAWHYDRIRKARVTVTGVPPGLAPAVFNSEILETFASNNATLVAAMAFRPHAPQRDLATTEAHFEADIELRLAPWRLTAHSGAQLEMMRALAQAGVSPRGASALDVVRALAARPALWPGRLPAKLEVEATNRFDAAPGYLAGYASTRQPSTIALDAFQRLLAYAAQRRDTVLTLGGLGEPLLHSDLVQMVAAAKDAGILGVHVATFGRLLDSTVQASLMDAGVDVLSIAFGAWTMERYRALFGTDGVDAVRAAAEAAFAARRAAGASHPLIVPEITKTRAAEPDVEPFFEHWLANSDWPVIRPYNDFAGQIEDLATIHMRTSGRNPCRKVFEELYIDSEGVAWPCRQDIRRTRPLGNVSEGVEGLWHCEFMENLRAAQLAGDYDFFPLCRNCKDWYYA